MTPEEIKKMLDAKFDDLTNAQVLTASKEELKAISDDIELLKKMQSVIKTQGESITDLETKTNNRDKREKSFSDELLDVLTANADKLKAMKVGGDKTSLRMELKVVGNMALGTNVTGQIPQADREAGITRLIRRNPFILGLVSIGTIASNLWEWVEQKGAEGDAAMTGEGIKKSQADFDLVLASASVKKVTAFIKVTTEMLDDVELMRAEIDSELVELLDLKIDEQLLSGTGAGVNLIGILTNAVAFAAGVFALKIVLPTEGDVLRVAINQVRIALFNPNAILMHPSDVAKLELNKLATGAYIMPPFASIDGTIIKGLPVIENIGMTVGTYLVGDFSRAGVRFKKGVTIDVGFENDDFTKNFVTILAEARLVQRVKSNHYPAFVTGTFAAGIIALTKV